jgi:hypothetical protein
MIIIFVRLFLALFTALSFGAKGIYWLLPAAIRRCGCTPYLYCKIRVIEVALSADKSPIIFY